MCWAHGGPLITVLSSRGMRGLLLSAREQGAVCWAEECVLPATRSAMVGEHISMWELSPGPHTLVLHLAARQLTGCDCDQGLGLPEFSFLLLLGFMIHHHSCNK